MDGSTVLISLLCGLFVWGPLSFNFAKKRGRNPIRWYTLGFFFGLIGFSILMLLKPNKKQKAHPQEPVIEPKPALSYWYYLDGEQQIGPMSSDALKKAFIEDKVKDSTYVWNEDLTDWQPLGQLPIHNHLTQV